MIEEKYSKELKTVSELVKHQEEIYERIKKFNEYYSKLVYKALEKKSEIETLQNVQEILTYQINALANAISNPSKENVDRLNNILSKSMGYLRQYNPGSYANNKNVLWKTKENVNNNIDRQFEVLNNGKVSNNRRSKVNSKILNSKLLLNNMKRNSNKITKNMSNSRNNLNNWRKELKTAASKALLESRSTLKNVRGRK